MKITNEAEYSQALARFAAIEEQIKNLKREFIDLETEAMIYQNTTQYASDRNLHKFADIMESVKVEIKTYQSNYREEK